MQFSEGMEGPCPKQLVVDIEDGNRDMHTRLDRCLQLVEQMAADRQLRSREAVSSAAKAPQAVQQPLGIDSDDELSSSGCRFRQWIPAPRKVAGRVASKRHIFSRRAGSRHASFIHHAHQHSGQEGAASPQQAAAPAAVPHPRLHAQDSKDSANTPRLASQSSSDDEIAVTGAQFSRAVASEERKSEQLPQAEWLAVTDSAGSYSLGDDRLQDRGSQEATSSDQVLSSRGRDELLQWAAHAYAGGRILEAYRTLQSYAQAGISYEQMIHTMRPEGLGDLRQLQQRAQLIQAGHDHVLNDKGWAVARNDYLRALYRHEKGSNVHSFKLSATFNEPLEHLVAMAREIDNVHHYDSILSGVVLDQPSLFEGSFYIGVKTPWPFKNMDFMLHAHGADLSEEHKCTVLMFGTPKSIPSDHLRKLPASAATCTRVTVLEGSCVLLRPLPPGPDGRPRTQGYMMVHLNPDLPSIPQLWIKLLLKVASPWLHGLVKGGLKTCFATPASVLSKRMAERPALYDLIRRRMSLF